MRHRPPDVGRDNLVGRRVVVRHRLHGEEHGATDVLGILEHWADGIVRVRRADGELHEIPEKDVIVVKPIPARPVTRREVRDLEAAALHGWRSLETQHLGTWLLRAADGFTRRANSCLALDHPGQPLPSAVDHVERWYRQRGLTPTFQVPGPLAGVVESELDARGWARSGDVLVLTADVDNVRAGERPGLPPVRIDARPDDAWLAAYHYRGEELPPHAVQVLTNADPVGFASVDDGGRRVAIARGAVSEAPSGRRWLGVTAVEVIPDARRRGLGSHVVAGLARWAAQHGARDAYLQVVADNTGAQSTYRKLGFGDHHSYHYRAAQ